MSVKERDPLTGHQTTGHEWDGITELNTNVPRIIWWFIGITHVYALVTWALLPSWPWIHTYWKGFLGADQQEDLQVQVVAGNLPRVEWQKSIADTPLNAMPADAALMSVVEVTGPALFGDNCAACHGAAGLGGPGFPNLADGAWLWGSDPATIFETIRFGINTQHPESRVAEMPAFGELLTQGEILRVSDYVQSLSGAEADPTRIAEGAQIFDANCSACHGEDAKGDQDIGAPNLADTSWIYGASDAVIYQTIRDGRKGFMPGWESRLTEVDRKILTHYVLRLPNQQEVVQ